MAAILSRPQCVKWCLSFSQLPPFWKWNKECIYLRNPFYFDWFVLEIDMKSVHWHRTPNISKWDIGIWNKQISIKTTEPWFLLQGMIKTPIERMIYITNIQYVFMVHKYIYTQESNIHKYIPWCFLFEEVVPTLVWYWIYCWLQLHRHKALIMNTQVIPSTVSVVNFRCHWDCRTKVSTKWH